MSSRDIEYLDTDAADVLQMIAVADAYYENLYPAESNHLESTDDLKKTDVLFVGCRIEDELVASGAAKIMHDDGDYAEIKRVFVLDKHRGKGLSNQIMNFLESELSNRGVHLLRLETGIKQPAALGLYRKLGYTERGPYGAYALDPYSVFMEKELAGLTGA